MTPDFESFLATQAATCGSPDGAHDLAHVHRVVRNAMQLMTEERADPRVVVPAAWLHDCIPVSKNARDRASASLRSADAAVRFLGTASYPGDLLPLIHHAIEAHSFSRGLTPRTIEARVVQDADRLDATGAIGIARCFGVGGALGRSLYCPDDPFCQIRSPDDARWTVDHFYRKLLHLADTMQTVSGQREARRRTAFMRHFLAELATELVEPSCHLPGTRTGPLSDR